jgi:hypothetical protein
MRAFRTPLSVFCFQDFGFCLVLAPGPPAVQIGLGQVAQRREEEVRRTPGEVPLDECPGFISGGTCSDITPKRVDIRT